MVIYMKGKKKLKAFIINFYYYPHTFVHTLNVLKNLKYLMAPVYANKLPLPSIKAQMS